MKSTLSKASLNLIDTPQKEKDRLLNALSVTCKTNSVVTWMISWNFQNNASVSPKITMNHIIVLQMEANALVKMVISSMAANLRKEAPRNSPTSKMSLHPRLLLSLTAKRITFLVSLISLVVLIHSQMRINNAIVMTKRRLVQNLSKEIPPTGKEFKKKQNSKKHKLRLMQRQKLLRQLKRLKIPDSRLNLKRQKQLRKLKKLL
jgi:hypothetical protein